MALEVGQNASAADFRGLIFPYAGPTAPAGFLMCDGGAVSRTTYAGLFALIGITYGAGNGSTTFNVPDLRGSVIVGAGAKSVAPVASVAYTGIDIVADTIEFASPHGLLTGQLVAVAGAAGQLFLGTGASSGLVSVDGAGSIAVGGTFAAAAPVGTIVRCINQSSSNFGIGSDYYVISNNGTNITVSGTPGGSIAGSGNSGSVNMQLHELISSVANVKTWGPSSELITAYNPDGGNYLKLDWFLGRNLPGTNYTTNRRTELPQVGDVLTVSSSFSLTGPTSGPYYVVEVDPILERFAVSATLGGTPIAVSGGGGLAGTITRSKWAVIKVSDTKVRLAAGVLEALDNTIGANFTKQGSGSITLTADARTLVPRTVGQTGGEDLKRLSVPELPGHSHRIKTAASGSGTGNGIDTPGNSGGGATNAIYSQDLNAYDAIERSGSWKPFDNMPPFVVCNYIIKT